MNLEKSLDIIKGKLLMIDKMLKQDQEEGHGSAYEMQTEDFEAIETLLTAYEKEKEKNKELTDKLKDCDLHYSKLYKFHNNNCVTKDRINQIIDELIKLYFEEDSYCFSGFMFNNKTFNSLNIKEEMTVIQLLKHLQRLLKQGEE